MSRRKIIRLISFTAAAFVVLGGFTLRFKSEACTARRALYYYEQRAMNTLTDSMNTIADALEKERYSVSPALQVSIAAKIWREAGAAASALGELPLSHTTLDKSSRFIAQAGDFAYYLARKAASGQKLTDEEQASLTELGRIARDYCAELSVLDAAGLDKASDRELSETDSFTGGYLSKLEQDFPEYPTLIYDGPLSDHIERRTPAMLEGKDEVSIDEARKNAAKFMGIAADRLTLCGESDGRIHGYSFAAEADGRHWYCDAASAGGIVTDWSMIREVGTEELSVEEAIARAEKYLRDHGMLNMKSTYWVDEDGVVLINFAAVQNDVILYPDLIKVGIARDTGEVIRYEATGYVMCHRERELPDNLMDSKTIAEQLDDELIIESTKLVLIPTQGEHERLCYEFLCRDPENTGLLIYCDAQTGEAVEILILVENDNGTLTV